MSSAKTRRRVKEEDPSESEQVTEWRSSQQRRAGPEHFLLTVESFSVLSESKLETYESDEFEASGYKWRLILYPKGDKERNGSNHVSLYLSITDTEKLSQGWEVNTNFTLFVYNHISDMYLTFHVANASARRFHQLMTERGFAQLIELDYLKESSNGLLFDDTCVFGAEVSVANSAVKRQRLSMIKIAENTIFTWRVTNFSMIKDEFLYSNKFKMGELEWKLQLYPKRDKCKSISLFLVAANDELKFAANWKAYAEYKLRIRNQWDTNHVEKSGNYWFDKSLSWSCGYNDFMTLYEVNGKSKGFLVSDTLVVEVEMANVAIIKNFK